MKYTEIKNFINEIKGINKIELILNHLPETLQKFDNAKAEKNILKYKTMAKIISRIYDKK